LPPFSAFSPLSAFAPLSAFSPLSAFAPFSAFAFFEPLAGVASPSAADGSVSTVTGATGWLLGPEGRGVRTIIDMVSMTRLDCVLGSSANIRIALSEAAWHARHRSAFGARLTDQPAMTAVLADLALESEAATALAMRLAATPCGPLYSKHVSPDRELAALLRSFVPPAN